MCAKQAIIEKEVQVRQTDCTNHPVKVLRKGSVPLKVSDEVLYQIADRGIKIGRCPECGYFGGEIVIKMPTFWKNELYVQCPRCGHMSGFHAIHQAICGDKSFGTPITDQSITSAIRTSIKEFEEGELKMNGVTIFENKEFGSIRTIEENGKVIFCGADVATALGYSKPNNAISAHCRYALKRGTPHPQSPNKQIEMTFIPEGDVYRLITHSKLPSAEKFERWVFDEVLPSIRKTGGYISGQETMSDSELMAKALFVAQRQIEERNKLIASQKQIIGELTPKVEYADIILNNKGLVTITQIAKDYGMSGSKLNRILADLHVQYKQSGQWLLYSAHQNKGWTHSKTINITRSDGSPDVVMETKWTQKGRLALYELLKKNGIVPSVEK